MKNAPHPLGVIKDAIKTGTAYVVSSKRNKIIAGIGLALSVSGIVPLIHTKYKGYKARQAIEETSQKIASFNGHIQDAHKTFDNNNFLFVPDERYVFTVEISKAEGTARQVQEPFTIAQKKYAAKQYDDVRKMLIADFNLKKGEQPRLTPLRIVEEGDERITKSLNEMNHKRESRDKVIEGEDRLKARLASPYQGGMLERKEKHAHLSDEAFRLIPILDENEFEIISGYEPELQNSFGVNLLHHIVMRDHIRATAKAEGIGKRAQSLFDEAKANYMQVPAANNAISLFYRAKNHDGTYTQAAYQTLLAEQQKPLDLILKGDTAIRKLEGYNKELHTQYYVYVSGLDKSHTTFSHSRTVMKPVTVTNTTYDSNGNATTTTSIEMQSDIEYYSTDGFKFYYDVTTVTPTTKDTEKIYVGEKDEEDTWSYRSWDYEPDQQVNYLREWKQLHLDNAGIIRGGNVSQVKPFETCNPHVVELEKSEEQQ